MAMRPRFRRAHERVFNVNLTVHQLDSIPVIHRAIYVYWRARRAQPSEGRTPAQPVEPGNVVRWNISNEFSITIPSELQDPTLLQPAPFDLQLRSERRNRWVSTQTFDKEGRVQLDLSEIAAQGTVSRNYLVQDSLLNMTLRLTVRVTHQEGDKIFRTRTAGSRMSPSTSSLPFPSTPSMSRGSTGLISTDAGCPFATHQEEIKSNIAAGTTPGCLDSSSAPCAIEAVSVARCAGDTGERIKPNKDSCASSITTVQPNRADQACPSGPVASSAQSIPSSSQKIWDDDTSSSWQNLSTQSPSCVLEKSIPNPETVQRPVYEKVFQKRMRDDWPSYVTDSRFDAETVVNSVYAVICAADGIVTAPKELLCGEQIHDGGGRAALSQNRIHRSQTT